MTRTTVIIIKMMTVMESVNILPFSRAEWKDPVLSPYNLLVQDIPNCTSYLLHEMFCLL